MILRILVWIWALILLAVSLMPGDDLPELNIWQVDKVFHVLFYLIFVVLMRLGYPGAGNKRSLIIFFLIAVFYGLMIEVLQENFVKNRYFDIYDIGANAVGAAIALIIVKQKRIKTWLARY